MTDLHSILQVAENEIVTATEEYSKAKAKIRGKVARALIENGQEEFVTVQWAKLRASGVNVPREFGNPYPKRGPYWCR